MLDVPGLSVGVEEGFQVLQKVDGQDHAAPAPDPEDIGDVHVRRGVDDCQAELREIGPAEGLFHVQPGEAAVIQGLQGGFQASVIPHRGDEAALAELHPFFSRRGEAGDGDQIVQDKGPRLRLGQKDTGGAVGGEAHGQGVDDPVQEQIEIPPGDLAPLGRLIQEFAHGLVVRQSHGRQGTGVEIF